MKITRRQLGGALGGVLSGLTLAPEVGATTALEWSLADLVGGSERCVVGEAVFKRSEWMFYGGEKRIVTFTRFLQEEDLLSENKQEDELEVLTLGGVVGTLMQKVPGTPSVRKGERCLLFVSTEWQSTRSVVGMAQGHFPLHARNGEIFLERSQELPHLVPGGPRHDSKYSPSAIHALPGLELRKAAALIKAAR